jgi:hypothetical protein
MAAAHNVFVANPDDIATVIATRQTRSAEGESATERAAVPHGDPWLSAQPSGDRPTQKSANFRCQNRATSTAATITAVTAELAALSGALDRVIPATSATNLPVVRWNIHAFDSDTPEWRRGWPQAGVAGQVVGAAGAHAAGADPAERTIPAAAMTA